ARDKDQLWGVATDDALESGEQGLDLASAPIELLGNQQAVGRVVLTEWKVINSALCFPCTLATAKVALHAGGGLVAVFGRLREQLHDDRRNGVWNFSHAITRCYGPLGEMAVHPFHGVRSRKRQSSGQHLVKGDTESVEVAAGID